MYLIERILEDLRYSLRSLRRRPSFTLVAIVSLAVALGANTAVFSFARAIVIKTLPVPGADRLVILRQHNEMFHMENCCFTRRFFDELRKQDVGFEDVLAVQAADVNLTDEDETEKLKAEMVSGNYFRILAVRPILGRLIEEADDSSASRVCVISYRLWQERFGGRNVIGRRVLIDTTPFQIVGVTPGGFTGAALHETHEIELPESAGAPILGMNGDTFWLQLIARMKPGVTVPQATARLNAVGVAIQKQETPAANISPLDTYRLADGGQGIDSKKEQFGKPVLLLFGLVGVVLVAACTNLAALLLVRAVERTAEAGVRLALGGSRAALVRPFLAESMILAIAGGMAGWVLAHVLTDVLLKMLGAQGEGLAREAQPDGAVFAFCAGVTLAAGVVFGFWPAWRAAQADPLHAIRRKNPPRGRFAASRVLVAAQMALSLALLFGAGLFVQTLHNLRSIDVGFHPESVSLLHLDLSRTTYAKNAEPFFDELLHRAREMPETRAASLSTVSVLSGSMMAMGIRIPGYTPANGMLPTSYFTAVSGGYFRTLGIPLIAGRDLTDDDRKNGAVIVNQQFARQFFQNDALGKAFQFFDGRAVRVVGIAADAHFRRLREEPQAVMYLPMTEFVFRDNAYLQVRSTGNEATMAARLRDLVRQIDPRVPVDEITTMEMQIDQALSRERLLAFLSTMTGAMAVLLAAIGLYGVMSFSVAQRRREIGIRIAIGAPRRTILKQFLIESAWLVLAGAALGVPLMLACGRAAASLLYGLQPEDAATAIAATAVLGAIALAGALIPAWRAARVDPTIALRWE
jgi:predicted permease